MSFNRGERNISGVAYVTILFYLFLATERADKMKRESDFQSKLKKELKERFSGCIVTKLDSGDIQGIPDLLVLYKNKWATLECKKSSKAKTQPNQPYYVETMNEMSFSRFIYPENKEEVLDELGEMLNK